VEYGCFLGYTSVRLGGLQLRRAASFGFGRQEAGQVASFEFDAVHVCCSLHIIDIARLRHMSEVWAGHVPWLTPRLSEDFGAAATGLGFMDHKGTRFHLDLDDFQRLRILQRTACVLIDNVLNPGAPELLWRCSFLGGGLGSSRNWAMLEHGRHFEDWMSVQDLHCLPAWGSSALGARHAWPGPRPQPLGSE